MTTKAADAAIGLMDGSHFASRNDLLEFFNNLLLMNLTKIEQTASGAVACQLIDYIFPGSIPMKRVNWEAKSDFQFIENYKILQVAFTKSRVQKHIDVNRLVRAKCQDNLEFCQWLKAFYEYAAPDFRADYDPIMRRSLGKGGKNLDGMFLPKSKNNMRSGIGTRTNNVTAATRKKARDRTQSASINRKGGNSVGGMSTKTKERKENTAIVADADLMKKNQDLKRKNAELELTLTGVEHERDFYFDKLRGIEVMLQVHEEDGEKTDPHELLDRIFKVLYAKSEENLVVTDEGELLQNSQQENIAPESDELLNDSLMMDE